MISRLFKWGLRCFQMLGTVAVQLALRGTSPGAEPSLLCAAAGGGVGSGGQAHVTVEEEREILDNFAGVFTYLEPHYFRDVFQSSMKTLFGTHRRVMHGLVALQGESSAVIRVNV